MWLFVWRIFYYPILCVQTVKVKLAWAFAIRLCDKDPFHTRQLICLSGLLFEEIVTSSTKRFLINVMNSSTFWLTFKLREPSKV